MADSPDPDTKAILQGMPPEMLAPPDVAGFTLVLLSKSSDLRRFHHGLAKSGCGDAEAIAALYVNACPQVVATGLALRDALLAQFELACCDCVAVFIRDAVVTAKDDAYLSSLYSELLGSEEFLPVEVEVRSVPRDDRGRRFWEQFVGGEELLPHRCLVLAKKARLLQQWGQKIGADVGLVGRAGL